MRLADLPEVRALSAREKLQLLDELWQEVAHHLDTLEVSQTEKELLDLRWAAFLRGPAALSLEQFKERVQALRPCLCNFPLLATQSAESLNCSNRCCQIFTRGLQSKPSPARRAARYRASSAGQVGTRSTGGNSSRRNNSRRKSRVTRPLKSVNG